MQSRRLVRWILWSSGERSLRIVQSSFVGVIGVMSYVSSLSLSHSLLRYRIHFQGVSTGNASDPDSESEPKNVLEKMKLNRHEGTFAYSRTVGQDDSAKLHTSLQRKLRPRSSTQMPSILHSQVRP